MSKPVGSKSKLQGLKSGKSPQKRNVVKSTIICKCGKRIYRREGRCAECYAKFLGVKLLPKADRNQEDIYNLSINSFY